MSNIVKIVPEKLWPIHLYYNPCLPIDIKNEKHKIELQDDCIQMKMLIFLIIFHSRILNREPRI